MPSQRPRPLRFAFAGVILYAAVAGCGSDDEAPAQPRLVALKAAVPLPPLRERARTVDNFLLFYGPWDSAKIDLAKNHHLVICHPSGGALTRAVVEEIQKGVNPADPSDDVLVLGYVSIGEDIRTSGLTDSQMSADPRFRGDGTGPRIDPRGPNADGQPLTGINPLGAPSSGGTGYASWYLDDNSVDRTGVGDGVPDRNGIWGSCFVNAGDPNWYAALKDMTYAAERVFGIREILSLDYGRGLGCDGVFLDTVDTAAPNYFTNSSSDNQSEFEWTAPGFAAFMDRLRGDYPGQIILQNRGLFFLDPRHPHYAFTSRGKIDLLLFESYRLDNVSTQNPDPYDYPNNRYNVAPKLMAEANRADGFRVLSLGYAEGPSDQMSQDTLTGGSTLGFDSLIEDIRVTQELAGFRHYLTDRDIVVVNRFVRDHANLNDTTPPIWTSTHNTNQVNGIPVEATPRIGIQQAVPGTNTITVRWDVAMDMNRVLYRLYYQTTPFNFSADPDLLAATRVDLTPNPGTGYASGPGPAVYANEDAIPGLQPGQTYHLVIRAADGSPAGSEEKNQQVLTATLAGGSGPATYVAERSVWKFHDLGQNLGTAWRATSYNDSTWSSGAGPLGYGESYVGTPVSYGGNASLKRQTTYFRKSFSIVDASAVQRLTARVMYDDGFVLYLNGTEALRASMPSGTISYTTLALNHEAGNSYQTFDLTAVRNLLRSGTNVVAVEVHQVNRSSSDLVFDLELTAQTGAPVAPSLLRGPYLQRNTTSGIVVRWRTDVTGQGRVRYGPAPNQLSSFVDGAQATDHEVTVSGLAPDTRYYYSVETAGAVLASGSADQFFTTSPPAGTGRSFRFWVLGDAGTAGPTGFNADQLAVRDAFATYTGTRGADLMLLLGDNAYHNGTDTEYQNGIFNIYASFLKKMPVWSAFGNHDGDSANALTQTGPYFNIFTFPRNGEAGGLASGTEAYYSFDYGDIHFVSLDSTTDESRVPGSPMATWLRSDLAATSRKWVVVSFHHPPYTKGNHDSDNPTLDPEPVEMRGVLLPILEEGGVDLILCGHSHDYERTFLLDGHYGLSTTLTDAMKKDGATGSPATPYRKPTGLHPRQGIVCVVAGSSGKKTGGSLNHPAMVTSQNQLGSLVVDVQGDRLDVRFLRETGAIGDEFTILKEDRPVVMITGPTREPEWTTTSSSVALQGTASGLTSLAWTNRTTGATGPASGATSWSASVGLAPGLNIIEVSGTDAVGRSANDKIGVTSAPSADTILIPAGAAWKYHDRGVNLGTAWRPSAFDDASWSSGPAPLGYGEPYLRTTLSWGPNASQKYPTAYFRKSFTYSGGTATSLQLAVSYDDGFVAYLNGTEVARRNLSASPVAFNSWADVTIEAPNPYVTLDLTPFRGLLVAGQNVLAVEVHQRDGASSDLVWDAELRSTGVPADTTPPAVSIFSPAESATVSGTTTVQIDASDDTGVSQVELRVDGQLVGTVTTPPYYVSWDTTTYTNGPHILQARARDAAGNTTNTVDRTVTVSNTAPFVGTLIATRSAWRHHDAGQDLGTGWRAFGFNDSAWKNGAGPLGYGESYLSTVTSFGSNPSNKPITTYFRRGFTVTSAASVRSLLARVMYDDGFVIYLNGVEVRRAGLGTGPVAFSTTAQHHEAVNSYEAFDLTPHLGLLREGANEIAVEVHQVDPTSSDLVFDLGLDASQ